MKWRLVRMRGVLLAAVALLGVATLPGVARAEVYRFVDKDGVTHFTNIDPKAARVSHGLSTIDDDSVDSLRRHYRLDDAQYDTFIVAAAQYYTLPAALVKAVVAVESSFQHDAVSHAGAVGLMQLVPETARHMFVEDPRDPRANIYGGSRYLRILANRFGGNLRLTLAAYNAGPERVESAGGVPNIRETRSYVRRVLALYRHYRQHWQPLVLR